MRSANQTLLLTLTILVLGGLTACASEEKPQAAPPADKAAVPAAPAKKQDAPAAPAPAAKPASGFQEPEGGGEPGVLTAFADVDESIGDVPHEVQLNVDVIPNTGHPPFTYIWDFGDATEFSTEKAPKHTYKIPGSFRASVIVTDSKGEIDQDYFDISVNEALPAGAITAEQLMQMMPPGTIAEEIEGIEEQIREQGGPDAPQ